LSTREAQQLARQALTPGDGAFHRGDVGVIARNDATALEDVELAPQDQQNVVEVVHNPTCELSQPFHLLRLPQDIFGALVVDYLALESVDDSVALRDLG
jgi:hypothetical protein